MVTKKALEMGKELAKVYNTITLKEIEETETFDGRPDANTLTGFNSTEDCCLCRAVSYDIEKWDDGPSCYRCIYEKPHYCFKGENKETFEAILKANTSRKLLNAYRKRGEHILQIIKKLEKKYEF